MILRWFDWLKVFKYDFTEDEMNHNLWEYHSQFPYKSSKCLRKLFKKYFKKDYRPVIASVAFPLTNTPLLKSFHNRQHNHCLIWITALLKWLFVNMFFWLQNWINSVKVHSQMLVYLLWQSQMKNFRTHWKILKDFPPDLCC